MNIDFTSITTEQFIGLSRLLLAFEGFAEAIDKRQKLLGFDLFTKGFSKKYVVKYFQPETDHLPQREWDQQADNLAEICEIVKGNGLLICSRAADPRFIRAVGRDLFMDVWDAPRLAKLCAKQGLESIELLDVGLKIIKESELQLEKEEALDRETANAQSSYVDIKPIGSGGFGQVWETRQESDGQAFAKKILLTPENSEDVRRFKREIRICKALKHPNIVAILDTHLEDGENWFIMPLYTSSLSNKTVELRGNLARIDRIFRSILLAIDYAHQNGFIHRDLKPENILLNSDDDVVVSDFGLARDLQSKSTRYTDSNQVMGTVLFMAPEQLGAFKHADEKTDVFALGRILLNVFVSEPMLSIEQELRTLNPAIASVIRNSTRNDAEKRFQTVAEMSAAWTDAVQRAGSHVTVESQNYEFYALDHRWVSIARQTIEQLQIGPLTRKEEFAKQLHDGGVLSYTDYRCIRLFERLFEHWDEDRTDNEARLKLLEATYPVEQILSTLETKYKIAAEPL
jgi:hypothetical protein